jgi:hypothetical protein
MNKTISQKAEDKKLQDALRKNLSRRKKSDDKSSKNEKKQQE